MLMMAASSGVDFDDVDYGFKEEDKSKSKVSRHSRCGNRACPANILLEKE